MFPSRYLGFTYNLILANDLRFGFNLYFLVIENRPLLTPYYFIDMLHQFHLPIWIIICRLYRSFLLDLCWISWQGNQGTHPISVFSWPPLIFTQSTSNGISSRIVLWFHLKQRYIYIKRRRICWHLPSILTRKGGSFGFSIFWMRERERERERE